MKFFFAAFLMGIPLSAFSQNLCPAGQQAVIQGGALVGCIPGVDDGGSVRRPRPIGEWRDSWGAMAMSREGLILGASLRMRTKREAERQSISYCEEANGVDCKVVFTIKNQCGALVFGSSGKVTSGHAPDVEGAEFEGLEACKKINQGGRCDVRWSDCSETVFVKY